MMSFKLTTVIAIVFSLASGAIAQNGMRGCIGGAISCEYPKGRCARICSADGSSLSSVCSCPNGQADNPYTGASCITIFTAAGRQLCT